MQEQNSLVKLIGSVRVGGRPPKHLEASSAKSEASCANGHALEVVDQKLSLALGGIKDLRVGFYWW